MNRSRHQNPPDSPSVPWKSLIATGALISYLGASAWAENADIPAYKMTEAKELMAQKKMAEASVVLRSHLNEHPGDSAATFALANSLVYLGRRQEAVNFIQEQAAKRRGPSLKRLEQKAQILSRIFLTDETAQIYQDGVNFISFEKYPEARARFEAGLSKEPDNVELLLRFSQCLVVDGKQDSAAEQLRLARSLNPYEPEIGLWLGRALFLRGELKEAIEDLKSASKKLPQSDLAPAWLAEALSASGDRAGALDLLEKNIKSEPFHLYSLWTLARLRSEVLSTDRKTEVDDLWKSRRDLQVALSRYEQYSGFGYSRKFESELGFFPKQPAELKSDIDRLFKEIDTRIHSAKNLNLTAE